MGHFLPAIAPKVHHEIGSNPHKIHYFAGLSHTETCLFVESPGLSLRVAHPGGSQGVDTCQRFSLLALPTE
jgi:hypothetical protein